MDLDAELALLTAEGLTPMVCELLQDPNARALTWEVERVRWVAVNPGTLGIYRIRGVADTGDGQRPFSLVFKAVADVDLPGFPDTGYMHEPQDWNYWKREPLAFASGLLSTYQGPLVPVRCVGVEDRGDLMIMWLEELSNDVGDVRWSPERHVQAAHHLGRFNGDHVQNLPSASTYPWLCQRFTQGWIATLRDVGTAAACESDDVWSHPALRGAFPRPLGSRVASLLADADVLLEVGASLPLSLTHHDAHRDNMFRRDCGGLETTHVLDWGFLGLAPIGEDLGHQVGINVFHQYIAADNATEYERAAAGAYLSGLREARIDPDANRIRTYARAVAALQLASFAAAHVAWLSEDDAGDDNAAEAETWPAAWAAVRGMAVDLLMSNWAAAFDWFLNLGDDARRAAEAL